ncbi:MAG TPA: alpha-mannosidase, partial [Leptolyngbyaceae cyanobacterium]
MSHLTEVMNVSGAPESQLTLQFIEDSIDRLRSLSQYSVLENWRFVAHSSEIDLPGALPDQDLPLASLNKRNHIPWSKGKQCCWLYQRLQWPTDIQRYSIQGYKAKLALRWWADLAELYVNGECIQTGDLFDCFTRLPLSESVEPGQSVDVALKLVSPGHDDGALVRSHLIFESHDDDFPEPGFIADELAVLYCYLKQFAPDELKEFAQHLKGIAWEQVCDLIQFQTSLQTLRQRLLPWSDWIKQRQINCVGHAHLDLAWLWPIADTWDAAERTFQSVLSLQQDFPELTYTHSSPALFAWIEANRPALFQSIQEQVKQGHWAIDAGLWVEPELNIIGGEAIVRQILYGQRYCEEKFGQSSEIAWLPDTFGFNWQLPQLLAQGGIRCFATQKLRWNDTNPFPHDWCWWEGLDGTRILSLTLPLIGSDIDPIEMTHYAAQWEANTHISQSLWLPGVGDHGGGPTRDMLEKARRWAKSPFFPTLTFTHVTHFLNTLLSNSDSPSSPQEAGRRRESAKRIDQPKVIGYRDQEVHGSAIAVPDLPIWKDELYLELHRGCYTTHADQKWYNRRCEDLLYQAEVFSSIATLVADQPYPQEALETTWKQVLFNQFHDILPGSSIPEVFEEANKNWQLALQSAGTLLESALQAISNCINFPSPPVPNAHPIVVFNSLNWDRTELVAVPIPRHLQTNQSWQILDAAGKA